jgi:hypothetical protein
VEESRVPGGEEGQAPDQEELQRRLEEQIKKVRVQDLLLESVASILNLSARRIGKEDERDLEQARVGIEAVRAVLELIDPEPREQVREALSQVQMLYAREAQGAGGEGDAGGEGEDAGGAAGEPPPRPAGERPSGLWTPPGSS